PIEAIATVKNFPPDGPAQVPFSAANGAVRRDAVLARPFDDEIPIAEDYLWARGVHPPLRITYVRDAVVSHAHPMGYVAWRERFYAHGLAAAYARRRLGMELPWGSPDATAGGIVTGRAGAFVALVRTLAENGEVRALGKLPAYALARVLAYPRGLRDGAR